MHEFSIFVLVTENKATAVKETINRAPLSLAEHNYKQRAVNLPVNTHN